MPSTIDPMRNDIDIQSNFSLVRQPSIVGLDSLKKGAKRFCFKHLARKTEVSSPKQWHQIATCLNPADHDTLGLETKDIQQKWLEPSRFLHENESSWNEMNKPRCAAATRSSKTLEPVADSSKLST